MKFVVAAVQMLASSDKEANLKSAEAGIRSAASGGARVVALPEVFNWRGKQKEEKKFAEPIPGPTSSYLAGLASELKIFLLGGSILESSAGSPKAYNTSLLFDPEGRTLATYRKIHLFDVSIEEGVSAMESETREAGKDVVVAKTSLGTMGLSICYDLRFPELYRGLSTKGAEIIFVPSAFTAVTGKAHWEPLLRCRAIENQVYLVAANQVGKNPHSFETYGHSMVIDPWGRVMAQAVNGPEVIFAEIDQAYLSKVRRELPALTHRKLI